ncbi:C6 zinc finger domain protein [Apiospora kogelbergensis]|uniref:C6 zinc finger domain protein n=1 Tax=Apiospora kogelbergensis TaxID=1337665 RepID=UPI00312DFFE6
MMSLATIDPRLQQPSLRTDHHYWELRAFHHFTVATSATLPGSHAADVRDCFAVQAPILALSHKPLWNEMVALAALHLLSTAASEGQLQKDAYQGLLACREASLAAALQTYRPILSELGPHNADAAGFTAILLLVDAFATLGNRPLLMHENDENAPSTYAPPMQWLRIARGARTVLEEVLVLASAPVQENVNGPTTKNPMSILTIITSYPTAQFVPTEAAAAPTSHFGTKNPFSHLMLAIPGEATQPPEILHAYIGAVEQLHRIQAAIDGPAPDTTTGKTQQQPALLLCRGMLSFPCLVPPLFLDLVEWQEPRALVLLAHFFALMIHVGALWCVGDTPAREVRAIYRALPPRYHGLMRIPLELVGRPCNGGG